MEIISRPKYIEHILKFSGKGLIIALTGQRRVGKSYILMELSDVIRQRQPNANIVFINKEKKQFADITNDNELSAYIADKFEDNTDNYLLIDEVQDIAGFEHTLRSLNADETCQIIVTGSNAKMLSSELSTYIGGRYIDIHIQSLSYREFLTFHKLEDSPVSLDKYLKYGGLPHLRRFGLDDMDVVWDYLQNIYNTIVLKDVIQREGLRNVTLFENLMSFLSDNTGQLVSSSSLSKYLKSQQIALTPSSAVNYLRAAANAFIINKVPRYDIHGKRLLETIDKYYFEDLGLRNLLTVNTRSNDIEKIMENAVYLHLKNAGFKVRIGTIPNGEIDFIAERANRPIYVQVAYLLTDDKTRQREFGNLLKITDNYPKYVVTMSPIVTREEYRGIIHIPLREFLLTENL